MGTSYFRHSRGGPKNRAPTTLRIGAPSRIFPPTSSCDCFASSSSRLHKTTFTSRIYKLRVPRSPLQGDQITDAGPAVNIVLTLFLTEVECALSCAELWSISGSILFLIMTSWTYSHNTKPTVSTQAPIFPSCLLSSCQVGG